MPWYTKAVILMTGAFSVAVFAIPASMLTWGFEAEAERLAAASRRRTKCGHRSSSGSEWESDDSNSTDEEYQKIISGEGDDPNDDNKIKKLLSIFRNADTDHSGTLNVGEFVNNLKDNLDSVSGAIDGSNGSVASDLSHRVITLESKVDAMSAKLDQLIEIFMKQG